jgi:hypothetical protein
LHSKLDMTAIRRMQSAIDRSAATTALDAGSVCLVFLLSTVLLHCAVRRYRSRAMAVGRADANRR